eukprot:314379_1
MSVNPEWERMGQIERGALLFQIKCQRCHSNQEGYVHRGGPNLWGVFGRLAGSTTYKKYSAELKRSGLIWNRKNLKEYMHDPKKMVPGTIMFYGAALPADQQTECIVSYLESISPKGPIPPPPKKRKAAKSKASDLPGHPEVAVI